MIPKFVDDWAQCWRWFSVQLIALCAALQASLLAFPEARSLLTEPEQRAVTLLLLAGAIAGRLVNQNPPVVTPTKGPTQ